MTASNKWQKDGHGATFQRVGVKDASNVVASGVVATDVDGAPFGGNVNTGALITLAAAGAGTTNGGDQTNIGGKGLHLTIDITAVGGTPTLTVTIQGKDSASGKYYTILASAALSAVATTVLRVYPGLTASANVTASDVLPRTWRVIAAVAGTTPSVTATIAASVVL